MSTNIGKYVIASALLLLMGSTAQAATLHVNCGAREGLNSIGAALKALQSSESHGPATVNVSGTCYENVLIKNMGRLTLNAVNGASIVDVSNGNDDVVNVGNSLGFTMKGFSIIAVNRNNDGISCFFGSSCMLVSNNLQGGFDGIGVYPTSTAVIVGGSLSRNTNGLNVRGDVVAAGAVIQQNDVGAIVQDGGRLYFRVSDPQYDGATLHRHRSAKATTSREFRQFETLRSAVEAALSVVMVPMASAWICLHRCSSAPTSLTLERLAAIRLRAIPVRASWSAICPVRRSEAHSLKFRATASLIYRASGRLQ